MPRSVGWSSPKAAVLGVLAVTAVLLDVAVWPAVAPFRALPDSVLALSLAMVLHGDVPFALGLAFAAGLGVDLVHGVLIGLGAVVRMGVVWASVFVARRAGTDRFAVAVALATGGAVVAQLGLYLGALAFGVAVPVTFARAAGAAVDVLLTTALFAAFYGVVDWLYVEASAKAPAGRRYV